ncbi:MAG: UDP-glucose/GDP-mannose dehydrogenase family protein [Chlamydiae bacterium CG10_big_fil_rev_8_21_14_0_10_42_34]|nr:MAG: UDP-glucose/GDP-mannose dehydrogenase family protein [Chlamydiae bacterium CG10_big_fil_rev_8_21_14_0_10_42_34]
MKISVVGLGKLGSPILAVLASKGNEVIGIDVNKEFVSQVNQGKAPIHEPSLQQFISLHSSKIRATSDYEEAISQSDVTLVIVPTPSGRDGTFSNEYLLRSMEQIGHSLKKKQGYHLVVIKSTVMPGSTGGEIKDALEKASERTVGSDLGLCYSPEFIALGSVIQNLLAPDLILIGESDKKAGDILQEIYRNTCGETVQVQRMNFVNAEIAKIAINTYVTTKISYANMLSEVCERINGADVDVVTSAVGKDSRIGSKYLRAGNAFGGPCFPRDNVAFGALATQIGARADLAFATQELNQFQDTRLIRLIEENSKGKKVGILGLSYKPGTYVVEESQGVRIANYLCKNGYQVSVYDPMALEEAALVLQKSVCLAKSVQECFEGSDTLVLMTPWDEILREISPSIGMGKTVIDCWRSLSRKACGSDCNLISLGHGSTLNMAYN